MTKHDDDIHPAEAAPASNKDWQTYALHLRAVLERSYKSLASASMAGTRDGEQAWYAMVEAVALPTPPAQATAAPADLSAAIEAWEYSFIHSSATGRGEMEVGPCLTYDREQAYGVGCIKQRQVYIASQPSAPQAAIDLERAGVCPLSDYEPGQWWLTELENLFMGGEFTLDTKRAAGVALNFAHAYFAAVAGYPALTDEEIEQVWESGPAIPGGSLRSIRLGFARGIESAIIAHLAPAAVPQAVAVPEDVASVPAEQCEWHLADDDNGIWESSCGEAWSFMDGGPKENRVSFCHHCGKPAIIARITGEGE